MALTFFSLPKPQSVPQASGLIVQDVAHRPDGRDDENNRSLENFTGISYVVLHFFILPAADLIRSYVVSSDGSKNYFIDEKKL